jgi:hypothetical protein
MDSGDFGLFITRLFCQLSIPHYLSNQTHIWDHNSTNGNLKRFSKKTGTNPHKYASNHTLVSSLNINKM